jgi:hypothetical protein
MRRLLIALATVLAGCTPMQWTRDGAVPPAEALEKDSASCRQQAWREAQYRSWAYRSYWGPPLMRRDPFGRAFTAWPYGPSPYPFYADPAFEETRLADFCMRAKGYELVPVERSAAR